MPGIAFTTGTQPDNTFIVSRVCGRFFNADSEIGNREDNNDSICSEFLWNRFSELNHDLRVSSIASMAPYRIVFKTDADEVAGAVIDAMDEAFTNEQGELPGGIVGFNLNFVQQDC